MHELSVCQALLRQVTTLAQQHQAQQVTRITVQVGTLSGVVPELLQQAFTIAQAGSVAENAELLIETLPIKVRCRSCGQDSIVPANRLLCEHCGHWQTQLISGDELLLASIDLKKNNHV